MEFIAYPSGGGGGGGWVKGRGDYVSRASILKLWNTIKKPDISRKCIHLVSLWFRPLGASFLHFFMSHHFYISSTLLLVMIL